MYFTHDLTDFVEYIPLREEIPVAAVNGFTAVEGKGTVILIFQSEPDGEHISVCISPVFYMLDLNA